MRYHVTLIGPKGTPSYGRECEAETKAQAMDIAKRVMVPDALYCGWPSIRKIEVKEVSAVIK